ncbi:MAG TPA: D-alanyl-D-alanine carboxypeptidase family protein [Opitutaceae bacterium]|nr:D-alanyl-D-alanine carboxypeptidase family protein [Opitutaceae bacterium]
MLFRLCSFLVASCLFAAAPLHAAKKKLNAPAFKGAIVVDAATGESVIEQNPDEVNPPASVTKLMTFLVVEDRIRSGNITLQTPVTVTAEDSRIGGTQVWLKEGEVFPVEELLYALLIQSANDAASALARTAAGSREAFVQMMNARAKELGMTHTTFRSPHGLPPSTRKLSESDLTTPRDLAILSRELLMKTDILRYTSVKTRAFRADSPQKVIMNNHNHLLGKVNGVDGLKTGFTNGAGFCLAATAQRNGRRIIAVVVGSPDRKTRDLQVGELIERGFAALSPLPPGAVTPGIGPVPSTSPIGPSGPISAAPSSANSSSPIAAPAPAPTPNDEPVSVTFPGTKKK